MRDIGITSGRHSTSSIPRNGRISSLFSGVVVAVALIGAGAGANYGVYKMGTAFVNAVGGFSSPPNQQIEQPLASALTAEVK